MIAEIFPDAYDAVGRATSRPFDRRRGFHSTLPMGRYVSGSLAVQCKTIDDLRNFLRTCRPLSDEKQFGKRDYWQPPEEFERRKAGDCEDFSLWTWRQLVAMGYDARFVAGRHGRYGIGHAWVMFFQDQKCFLVEPQWSCLGERMPRLSTLSYKPEFSVAWNGKELKYYAHKRLQTRPPCGLLWESVPEWLITWGWFWLRVLVRLPYTLPRKISRWLRKKDPVASGSTS